ncbi:cold-shock protein [Nocardia sp. NBC_01009]|uniref:cold-shock protein n=1 Tax=Nocardia sp. NBC_01009 TaxID=2975996 RepID=UPI00386E75AD|nr:cold-shock protein [Nocardia sp. NBC_01009]
MEYGTVRRFDPKKGFGFITRDGGGDIFVHHSSILAPGWRTLEPGQRVEFSAGRSPKGPAAQEVRVL